jgi:hypothetical protein
MTTKILVSLEAGPDGASAFVPDCPGCWVFGRTQEPWYMTRLNIDLSCKYPRDVFTMLDLTREAVVDCLKTLPREKMRGVFQPTRETSPTCNLWTARKSCGGWLTMRGCTQDISKEYCRCMNRNEDETQHAYGAHESKGLFTGVKVQSYPFS